jgi:hypothetical protein
MTCLKVKQLKLAIIGSYTLYSTQEYITLNDVNEQQLLEILIAQPGSGTWMFLFFSKFIFLV